MSESKDTTLSNTFEKEFSHLDLGESKVHDSGSDGEGYNAVESLQDSHQALLKKSVLDWARAGSPSFYIRRQFHQACISSHPWPPQCKLNGYGAESIPKLLGSDLIISKMVEIDFSPGERIRYEMRLPIWEEGETLEGVKIDVLPTTAPIMRILVNLPPTYPHNNPPQLQLMNKYLGNFAIDSQLFGDIIRTYISSDAVSFNTGNVSVFEGLTHVQSLCKTWYIQHLTSDSSRELQRNRDQRYDMESQGVEAVYTVTDKDKSTHTSCSPTRLSSQDGRRWSNSDTPPTEAMIRFEAGKGHGLRVWVSDEVVDRKSVFVGRAVRVTDEREVPLVVREYLREDKRAARSAHPAIYAYRISKEIGGVAGKVYVSDYDDDGEAQAGGRLQHLLEILELENVLVIVTRWWGGHKLGPDRFKYISQVARDALEVGGFLVEKDKTSDAKGKKGKK
nr:impact family protein [Cryptococcus depauperatus CBS 7855]